MLISLARRVAVIGFVVIAVAPVARAQTANQTVTFAVNATNQIDFSGIAFLTITTAVAGSAPTSASDATSAWAVTTNYNIADGI